MIYLLSDVAIACSVIHTCSNKDRAEFMIICNIFIFVGLLK